MDKDQFLKLVQKHLDGKTTAEEEELLIRLYDQFQESSDWPTELGPKKVVRDRVFAGINRGISGQGRHSRLKWTYVYGGVAAMALVGLFLFYGTLDPLGKESENEGAAEMDPNAITLTLDNGDIVAISENGRQKVYNAQGNELLFNNGGELDYSKGLATEESAYNELNVPYGKRLDLVLSDGTRVKLNAGTWLRYPVKFAIGQARKVFFKGEAYFDVDEDPERPFIVNMGDLNVEVLGTEFNLSFYPGDKTSNTVLVEGSVSLYKNGDEKDQDAKTLLLPGQLAAWDNSLQTMQVSVVDTSVYTAWKEGILLFKNATFREISKKLERYMDVQITNEYDFLDGERYTASFDQAETIEYILEYFNEDTPFEYSVQGNRITIQPVTKNGSPMN